MSKSNSNTQCNEKYCMIPTKIGHILAFLQICTNLLHYRCSLCKFMSQSCIAFENYLDFGSQAHIELYAKSLALVLKVNPFTEVVLCHKSTQANTTIHAQTNISWSINESQRVNNDRCTFNLYTEVQPFCLAVPLSVCTMSQMKTALRRTKAQYEGRNSMSLHCYGFKEIGSLFVCQTASILPPQKGKETRRENWERSLCKAEGEGWMKNYLGASVFSDPELQL